MEKPVETVRNMLYMHNIILLPIVVGRINQKRSDEAIKAYEEQVALEQEKKQEKISF